MTRDSAAALLARLVPIGLGVGLAAGFFGIGGGFLIVPGLILATAMPLPYAIGTSLVVVSGLGLTTATSYATSGLVDWGVTGLLVAGGVGRYDHRHHAEQGAWHSERHAGGRFCRHCNRGWCVRHRVINVTS